MAGQATGCNGHRHEHKHRRPSLVPHPTGDDDEKELVGVQGGEGGQYHHNIRTG